MEEKSLNAQQRIEKIAEYYDISVRKLSQKCGLSTTFYRSCQNFTIRTVNKITQAFPEVSRDFLLTGRGEMINGQRSTDETKKEMPSIVSNVMELINTADTYITIRDRSNYPSQRVGDVVTLKTLHSEALIFSGKFYGVKIVHSEIIIRKVVINSDNSLTLSAINGEEFPEITIGRDKIEKLYEIIGLISVSNGNV